MRMLLLLLALWSAPSVWGAEPTAPTAPTAVDYNVAASALFTSNVTSGSGANLKSVVEATTTCGTWILLPAGVSYSPASAITIPAPSASCVGTGAGRSATTGSTGAHAISGAGGLSATTSTGGDDYIVIASANHALLPAAGTRIDPVTDAANMATIVAPASVNGAFLVADTGIHHIRFIGIRIDGSTTSGCWFLQSASTDTNMATQPHHVYIERSYCHGHASGGTVRGVQVAGHDVGVVDSVIDEIRRTSAESQAILLAAGGPGPYLIRNNELVAASEDIMIGDNTITNSLVPADITITKNYIHKPWAWTQTSFVAGTALDASTASLDVAGTCVTLTVAPDSGWADGTYYWIATADKGTSYTLNYARLITAVGVCNGANSLTLTSAYPARTGTSGINYKVTLWSGLSVHATKNLLETKGSQRVEVTDNVFAIMGYGGQQQTGIQISARNSGSLIQDWRIENNLFKDVAQAIGITTRPTLAVNVTGVVSDGTTNCAGGGCVKITVAGTTCQCATGDTIQVKGVGGTTESIGIWELTKLTSTTLTIPVAFVNAFTGTSCTTSPVNCGSVNIYHAGTPTRRIAIKNNIFQDGSSFDSGGDLGISNPFISIDPFPVLTMSTTSPTAREDATVSTTGSWSATDLEISHNTCPSPSTPAATQKHFILFNESGQTGTDYATDWPMTNFTVRDNVCRGSRIGGSTYIIAANTNSAVGSSLSHNSEGALDLFTDSSRNWSNNVFYETWNGITHEWTKYTGADFTPNKMAILTDYTSVGYTSHSTSSLSNYVLADLYTTGTCTTNGTVTVTCSTSPPATIIKGVPFKINSVGTFRLVASVSGSTITLQSAYPTSNTTAAFTLGFKGWSHELNGTDPGADIPAVITAITGVEP